MPAWIIAAAIPFFFILIGLELLVAKRQKREVYRFVDAITDLCCGVGSQVMAVWAKPFLVGGFALFFEKYRIFSFSVSSVWTWISCFLLVDFAYYWWHRLSHEVNFLWAAHVVHHQSEDYNLAVALRQAWFTQFTSFPFYVPIAVLGYPPAVLGGVIAISTLYQFWIHTELVDRLPRFEMLFNAPMHHRVHHAINPQYLDKNYAAVLIVWDKLFGTYIEEAETPVYGTVKPFQSFNNLWANFEQPVSLVRRAFSAKGRVEGFQLLLKRPEWTLSREEPIQIPAVSRQSFLKYDRPLALSQKLWVSFQFLGVSVLLVYLLARGDQMTRFEQGVMGAWILWALFDFSGHLEARRWIRWSEPLRFITGGAVFLAFLV